MNAFQFHQIPMEMCSSALQLHRSILPRRKLESQFLVSSRRCGVGIRGLGYADYRNKRRKVAAARARNSKQEEPGEWMTKGDPYAVLGVSPGCTEEDIKGAFRSRVLTGLSCGAV